MTGIQLIAGSVMPQCIHIDEIDDHADIVPPTLALDARL